MSENCPYCGQDKGLKITYYNKLDNTGQHLICTNCLNTFFKNQQHNM